MAIVVQQYEPIARKGQPYILDVYNRKRIIRNIKQDRTLSTLQLSVDLLQYPLHGWH